MSKFITFEGPEGSGKSTQIHLLADYLQKQGHEIYLTREPGGTTVGNQIRTVVHDITNTTIDPITEILLYSASRAQLVAEIIKPKLAKNIMVLCDRYADSTYAYQGYGHRLNMTTLQLITEFATQSLKPDLTIYLDLPVEVGLSRKQAANLAGKGEWNRMDQLALDFHKRVREGYLIMAKAEANRWVVIDAQQSIPQIQQQIYNAIQTVSVKNGNLEVALG